MHLLLLTPTRTILPLQFILSQLSRGEMRKIEAWVRTTKEKYIDYFWHLEKVNNLRDAFTVSKKKKRFSRLPHPSPRPLKSGHKFVSLSVCLSEKGTKKCRGIKKIIHHLPLVPHGPHNRCF